MMKNIEEMWDGLSDNLGASRNLEPDNPLNFRGAVLEGGRRCLRLLCSAADIPDRPLPAMKNLLLERNVDGDNAEVSLCVSEAAQNELFMSLCFDLLDATKATNSAAAAIVVFFNRLHRWAELLRLGDSSWKFTKFLGLLGELRVIRDLMNESKTEPALIVTGWRGPNGDATDIGFDSSRIEVKTQRSTRNKVLKVSSLEQLADEERNLFVILNRISASSSGFSMESLIAEILSMLSGEVDSTLDFRRKLLLAGFHEDQKYIDEKYAVESFSIYEVSGDFPRLIPGGNTPLEITKASYEIDCGKIADFEVDKKRLLACLSN